LCWKFRRVWGPYIDGCPSRPLRSRKNIGFTAQISRGGSTPYTGVNPWLVVEGDSITAQSSIPSWIPYAVQTAATYGNTYEEPTGYNQATIGEFASQMVGEVNSVNAVKGDVVVLLAGTNDLAFSSQTPTQIYNNLRTMWRSYLDHGADYVVAVDVLPRDDQYWNSRDERNRVSLNNMINHFASDPVLAGYASRIRVVGDIGFNPDVDTVDHLHPNALGAALIGNAVGNVIGTLGGHPANEVELQHGFDAAYYLSHNPDVAAASHAAGGDSFVFALNHYNTYGWHEGRNPNAVFDTNGYLAAYADVAAAGMNPLTHYDTYGWHEGRDPSANFDTAGYLTHYTDVAAAHIDPMSQYIEYGAAQARSTFADGIFNLPKAGMF
jgi:lysophospholipase L1-like esterase